MNQQSAIQATAVHSAARLDLAAATATEEETEMEKRTDRVLDYVRDLPWAQGRDAVEARLEYLAKGEQQLGGVRGFRAACQLMEIRRRVSEWDAVTYRRAESSALEAMQGRPLAV
jgi:hypothetical protein